jgi:RimJ/RimL family protein N-acetyltransferase
MTFHPTAPRIKTPRLLLRPHRLEDFDAFVAMWADPEVTRFIGGGPSSRENSWSRLLRYAGHWSMLGFGFWAIEDKATGRFVGELGFHEMRRELVPAIEGTPEMGWTLVPAAQGRGLASEALGAVVAWGDAHFGGADFVCIINPDHARSISLAGKCGFRERSPALYRDAPVAIFRRPGAARRR